jgi:hypothetical protein
MRLIGIALACALSRELSFASALLRDPAAPNSLKRRTIIACERSSNAHRSHPGTGRRVWRW